MSVVDLGSGRVTATIPVERGPTGIALGADQRAVYVGHGFQGTKVTVIDTVTNAVVTSVPAGQQPPHVVAGRQQPRVYVGDLTGRVSVIDTRTNTVINSVVAVAKVGGLALTLDDARLVVTDSRANAVAVLDTATLGVLGTTAVGPIPLSPDIRGDNARAYIPEFGGGSISEIAL